MIAYGCAIADRRRFERLALAGIRESAGPEARVYEVAGGASIFRAYNQLLELARSSDEPIEALVLMHEDCRILDPLIESKLRAALEPPDVAIAGAVGAVGVAGIDWWVHERMLGRVTLVTDEPFAPANRPLVGVATQVGPGGSGEVDAADGMLLAFGRWALEHLRFDESLAPGFHGYDADICFQARELGRRVVVCELEVEHHRQSLGLSDRAGWKRAHIAFRRKWEERWPLPPPARGTRRTPAASDVAGPLPARRAWP